MQRIYDDTAAAALPAPPALTGTSGYFRGGVPGVQAATRVRYWWLNMLQEELMSLLAGAGVDADATGTVFTQALEAIKRIAGGNVTSLTHAQSPATLTADNAGIITVDATAGDVAITLPAGSSGGGVPLRFTFVRLDATTNNASVSLHAGDSIALAAAPVVLPAWSVTELSTIGGTYWTKVRTNSGFPTSCGATAATGSIGLAQAGQLIAVSGSSTTQTLADATTVPNVKVGFQARTSFTLTSAGGVFRGGALDGLTSVVLQPGDTIALISNATDWLVFIASPRLVAVHGVQEFPSSGTFTVPAGVTEVETEGVGGGGGSSGTDGTFTGSSGGAAGFFRKRITGLTPGQTIPVTIGPGGTAGASGATGNSGGDGGTTSFGAYASATGGKGGNGTNPSLPGGAGGMGSGGDQNFPGGSGSNGITASVASFPGKGGSSFYGGGGSSQSGAGALAAGQAPGSGAAGPYGNVATAGNAGAAGICFVRW